LEEFGKISLLQNILQMNGEPIRGSHPFADWRGTAFVLWLCAVSQL